MKTSGNFFIHSPSRAIRLWGRLIFLFAAVFCLERAHGVLYLTDGFAYPVGELNAWSSPNTNISVIAGNMTYPGLADTLPSGSGQLALVSVGSSGHTQSTNFVSASPFVTNGTVYCSFLLNCTALPTTSENLLSLVANGGGASGSADPLALYTDVGTAGQTYKLKIRHTGLGEISDNTNTFAVGVTNFIVLKYSFTTATNFSTAALFVDPPLAAEPTNANATDADVMNSDPANLAVLSMKAQSSSAQGNWNMDAFRVGTTWADVAPASGVCTPVGSISGPVSQSVYAGLTTSFGVASGGTPPLSYQWQLSTNGSTWNNILNATNGTYVTPATTLANSGNEYRCGVSVSCGGGSSNISSAATLTVVPAPIFSGVIVSNTWQSTLFSNPPPPQYSDCGVPEAAGDIESCWFALGSSTSPGIAVTAPGSMDLTVPTNSRTWFTYFTSNGVVNLNLGEEIKVTTIFQPQGVVNNTNGNLAFGLFNSYAPGAARVTGNLGSSSSGAGDYQGYDFVLNFSSTYHTNVFTNADLAMTPIEIRVRTNLPDSDMLGNSGDYTALGAGGSTPGSPGFVDNSVYTNVFAVARQSNGIVNISVQFTGPAGFNLSYSTNDVLNTNDIAFDTFALRPVNNMTTATNIIVSLVKVETATYTNQTVVSPIPISLSHSGGNVVLTWANPVFNLYAAPAATGTYSLISGATSGYAVPATNTQRYFRLVH
jgi:hypothetical protein